jgi:entericidin A
MAKVVRGIVPIAYGTTGKNYFARINLGAINMKRLLALMVLCMFSMGMVGCNTMAGAGKDVQKVGEKVEDKAEDCKDAKC